jgi:hypothetical protein
MNRNSLILRAAMLWLMISLALAAALLDHGASRATAPLPGASAAADSATTADVPVLAYYYIWFDSQSWNRAKTDYPVLGRYSSDDPQIMRDHIRWAKEVGIDGFIVSWKNTDKLSSRLKRLVAIAKEEDFKLVIIYQGLNFERAPLSIDKIGADLDYFEAKYGNNKVFDLFGRPSVIWSGTWEFSREEIAAVTAPRRDKLQILASEKSVDGYLKLADIVDGNAYYWSSVNPDTQPGYGAKLQSMADAVHSHGGLWIAPAAPGFDARLVGGTRVVERDDGATLHTQLNTAFSSSPDAVGVISWNEFSENSHIEPSCDHGTRYLQVIAELLGGTAPADVGACPAVSPESAAGAVVAGGTGALDAPANDTDDFDSSSPGGTQGLGVFRALMLGLLAATVGASVAIVARRSRTQNPYRFLEVGNGTNAVSAER